VNWGRWEDCSALNAPKKGGTRHTTKVKKRMSSWRLEVQIGPSRKGGRTCMGAKATPRRKREPKIRKTMGSCTVSCSDLDGVQKKTGGWVESSRLSQGAPKEIPKTKNTFVVRNLSVEKGPKSKPVDNASLFPTCQNRRTESGGDWSGPGPRAKVARNRGGPSLRWLSAKTPAERRIS